MTFYELLKNIINKLGLAVRTDVQTLSDEQKAQARENIGAVSETASINGKALTSDVTLTADDIGVYVQSEEPVNAIEGDIWVDTDAESHLDPEIIIDTTLTQSGQAADAKVVGGKLSELGVYVTPQMFGAVADGVTNDSAAIQAAIDSDETVFFPKGVYLINNTINITNKERYNLYAENAKIVYSGSNYAFEIKHLINANLNFGQIFANNGGCVSIISDRDNTYSQYVNINFLNFKAKTDCIYAYVSTKWVSEIRVNNGQFTGGEYGIRIVHDLDNYICDGWKVHNCGVEGVTTGFLLEAKKGIISNMSITTCRAIESFTTLIKTVGDVRKLLYQGTSELYPNWLDFSEKTIHTRIYAPIAENGGAIMAYAATVQNGDVLIEPQFYEYRTRYLGNDLVDGLYDMNVIFADNEMQHFYRRFSSGSMTKLKLNKYFGRLYGVNRFLLNWEHDAGEQLTVYDYQGNIIYDKVINDAWCCFEFEWFKDENIWCVYKR